MLRKYGTPEKGEVLDEKEHKKIWDKLKSLGKKSVSELSEEDKKDAEDKEST